VAVPLGLILKQPDLGTALVLMPLLVVALFSGASVAARSIFFIGWSVVSRECFLSSGEQAHLKPYQRERITSFLHPEEDAKGSGYHCCNRR